MRPAPGGRSGDHSVEPARRATPRPIGLLRAIRLLLPWLRQRPLLLFDFDGTLAPLQADRDAVRLPTTVQMDLRRLSRRWPVAVVSGRGRVDLSERLGRGHWRAYGSHGAEGLHGMHAHRARQAFASVRRWCAQRIRALGQIGLDWEDKPSCAALHAAPCVDLQSALAWVQLASKSTEPGRAMALQAQLGHRVINLTAWGAPDKSTAARHALRRTGARTLLAWGDDRNDEPAFAQARKQGLAFRVGPAAGQSLADWQLDDCRTVQRLIRRLHRLPRWV